MITNICHRQWWGCVSFRPQYIPSYSCHTGRYASSWLHHNTILHHLPPHRHIPVIQGDMHHHDHTISQYYIISHHIIIFLSYRAICIIMNTPYHNITSSPTTSSYSCHTGRYASWTHHITILHHLPPHHHIPVIQGDMHHHEHTISQYYIISHHIIIFLSYRAICIMNTPYHNITSSPTTPSYSCHTGRYASSWTHHITILHHLPPHHHIPVIQGDMHHEHTIS